MIGTALCACVILAALSGSPDASAAFEADTLETSGGALVITFIGHGTLMLSCHGIIIHVDPWSRLADYTKLPKADIVLVTHEHPDHLDPAAIKILSGERTAVLLTEACRRTVAAGTVMRPGDSTSAAGIGVEAVHAYNVVNKRSDGRPFHPRGAGNGYVITLGDTRVYVAGDTDNTPEMKRLRGIDVAFLPMNLPYTMTPEMVADAAIAIKPAMLYPYHYGETDPSRLVELLKGHPEIDVRIRKMN